MSVLYSAKLNQSSRMGFRFQTVLMTKPIRGNSEIDFYKPGFLCTNGAKILMLNRLVWESSTPGWMQNKSSKISMGESTFCIIRDSSISMEYANHLPLKKNHRNVVECETPGNCKKIEKYSFANSTYNPLPEVLNCAVTVFLYRFTCFFKKKFKIISRNLDFFDHIIYYLFCIMCLEDGKRHKDVG